MTEHERTGRLTPGLFGGRLPVRTAESALAP